MLGFLILMSKENVLVVFQSRLLNVIFFFSKGKEISET